MSSNDLKLAKIAELKQEIERLEKQPLEIPIYVTNCSINEISINGTIIVKKGDIKIPSLLDDDFITFDLIMVVGNSVIKYIMKIPVNFTNCNSNTFVINSCFKFNGKFLGVYNQSELPTIAESVVTSRIQEYGKTLFNITRTFNALSIKSKIESYKWHLTPVTLIITGDINPNYKLQCGTKEICNNDAGRYEIYNSYISLIFTINYSTYIELRFYCVDPVTTVSISADDIKINDMSVIESDNYFICNLRDNKYYKKIELF